MKQPLFQFIIDLDERGIFRCHVENKETGAIVWRAHNEDPEDYGNFWPITDGFIKNIRDMDGLKKYLVDASVIPFHSQIEYVG